MNSLTVVSYFVRILDVLTVLDVFVWNGSCVLDNHSTDDLRYLEDTPSGLVRSTREMRWRKKKSFSSNCDVDLLVHEDREELPSLLCNAFTFNRQTLIID